MTEERSTSTTEQTLAPHQRKLAAHIKRRLAKHIAYCVNAEGVVTMDSFYARASELIHLAEAVSKDDPARESFLAACAVQDARQRLRIKG